MRYLLPCVFTLIAGGAACNPTVFNDLERGAPTIALERPDGFPIANVYGTVMSSHIATLGGTLTSETISRLAIAGTPGTPFFVYSGYQNEQLVLGAPLFSGCEDDECGDDASTALAGFPSFNDQTSCIAVSSPTANEVRIRCETSGTTFTVVNDGPAENARAGASLAGLGSDSPAGVLLVGAPAEPDRGAVFALADGSPTMVELDLSDALDTGMTVQNIGTRLVATRLPGGEDVFATLAPNETVDSNQRIIVASIAAGPTVTVRGCIDSAVGGFGNSLAFGDVDGDDVPELVVGSDPTRSGGFDTVEVYEVDSLVGGLGCADLGRTEGPTPTSSLTCPANDHDIQCSGSGFGAGVAMGDINSDDQDDIIVGAPNATVGEVTGAGGVFVFLGPALTTSTGLILSQPAENDALGRTVTTLPVQMGTANARHEIVASAPGADAVFVFTCSGLTGDSPLGSDRCQTTP